MTDTGGHDPRDSDCRLMKVFENLTQKEKNDLARRLDLRARWVLSKHGKDAARYGHTVSDIVQEAMTRAFDERRQFPFHKELSLYTFFSRTIDSIVSHLGELAANRAEHLSIESDRENDHDGVLEMHLRDDQPNPEERLMLRDQAKSHIKALASDPQLQHYVRLRLTGKYSSAEEYAVQMNTTVQVVYDMNRRLARRRGRS